jgi:Protein of unknown function (DUF3309)
MRKELSFNAVWVKEEKMRTLLLILLAIILIGALPTWPYSANWGYYPSGGLGLLMVILLLAVLFRSPRTL